MKDEVELLNSISTQIKYIIDFKTKDIIYNNNEWKNKYVDMLNDIKAYLEEVKMEYSEDAKHGMHISMVKSEGSMIALNRIIRSMESQLNSTTEN